MDLQELVQIIESGQHGVPFDLKLQEDELARFAGEKIGGLAHDISVEISPLSVKVSGKTRMALLTMDVEIVGVPSLTDGNLGFDIVSVGIKGRPAPDFMRTQIVNAINDKLSPSQVPVKITRFDLGEGWVQVAGETK
ncbi:MAG: hypothetical protein Q7O66_06935 [Dehalococcoidia bacterium]|nr:hypothetical protein [Dehalococcoidia bacterium]